jgi:hypothetical protein
VITALTFLRFGGHRVIYLGRVPMKPHVSFLAAGILCACISTSHASGAGANPGVCNIRPADFLATFGYAASGQALAGNQLGIPVGPFTHIGTATGNTASQNGNNIVGTWSVTFEQNDASGHLSTFTFPGTFTISTTTCTGDFSWVNVGVVFHIVFVNHAVEFRAISTVPGVISSAVSGMKL